MTVNADGTIAALTVNSSEETPGLGQRCAEEEFTAQFIGKKAPLVAGENVEVLSGATITSTAVIEALNKVLPTGAAEAAPAAEAQELKGKAEGFQSDVKVTVTVNADGTIAALTVNSSEETPGLGQRCAEEEFTAQFIGKKAPLVAGENVDVLSGATITSTAVIEALNKIMK